MSDKAAEAAEIGAAAWRAKCLEAEARCAEMVARIEHLERKIAKLKTERQTLESSFARMMRDTAF